MTVSRALRNHPEVSAATRERILKLAEELKYKPHPLVSVWMTKVAAGRSQDYAPSIAWLSAYRDKESREGMLFRSGLFPAAKARAQEFGYRLEEHPLYVDGMTPRRLCGILYSRSCLGMIIPPLAEPSDYFDFDFEHFSAVAIGFTLRRPALHRVVVNHAMGMVAALDALRSAGKRKIGLVLKQLADERTNHAWTSKYLGYVWQHPDLDNLPMLVASSLVREEFSQWFRQFLPDAIVGVDHELLDWIDEVDPRPPRKRCKFVHLHQQFANDPRIYGVVSGEPAQVTSAAVDVLVGQIKRNEKGIPDHPRLILVPCRFTLTQNQDVTVP